MCTISNSGADWGPNPRGIKKNSVMTPGVVDEPLKFGTSSQKRPMRSTKTYTVHISYH